MRQCIKCRAEYSPIDNRSFHALPTDVDLRNRWLQSLGLTSVSVKKAYVCNDHFDDESFFENEEGRSRRRLKAGSLPTGTLVTCSKEYVWLKATPNEATDSIKNECTLNNEYNSAAQCLADPLNENEISNDSTSETLTNCLNNGIFSKKRKIKNKIGNNRKRVKFTDGVAVKYLSRSSFCSEEDWQTFLRYKKVQDLRLAAAHNKNARRLKKIKSLNGFIKKLEARKK